ncbi:MAG TPA: hypothetical protein VFZ76_01635, partial [Anaerolineales bacterium]
TFTDWLEHTLEGVHAGEFEITVALISTVLALIALGVAWLIYHRRYQRLQELPPARRPDDPLRPMLGPIFTGMERKWWVDELYWSLFVDRYIDLSRFLAFTVDWRFWHDWFHDSVIAAGYRGLSRVLARPIDLGIIDGAANGLARFIAWTSSNLRRAQTGYVRSYALVVFIGVVVMLGYLILR